MSIASPPTYASGCLPLPAWSAPHLVQHPPEAIERPVEIAPCNDKGRRKSDHGAVCLLREHSLGQEPLADLARARDRRADPAPAGSISAPTPNPRPRTSLSAR